MFWIESINFVSGKFTLTTNAMAIKKTSDPFLVYAINKDGALVHIDDVPNGLGCNCVCPYCKDRLIAKNGGTKNAHSFAHCGGADCIGAKESVLHLLAKEVLCEEKVIALPVSSDCAPVGKLSLDRVEKEEYHPELKLRPDCVGYYGEKQIWIEFKRSHAVDVHKEEMIISAHIDCIEIDLNDCKQDKEEIRKFITENPDKRRWIYNSARGLCEHNPDTRSDGHAENHNSYFENNRISRHYAIEDGIRVVNSYESDLDAVNHTYTCPSCGEEVFVDVDNDGCYSFSHIENKYCDYALYLKRTAKQILKQVFESVLQFNIAVRQRHECKHAKECRLANDSCVKVEPHTFDIKKHGFDSCKMGYLFEGATQQSDLVFCKGDSMEDAIAVVITHPSLPIEYEDWNIRRLQISIRSEYDIERLKHGLIDQDNTDCFRFKDSSDTCVEPQETSREFVKYTFYNSGKFYRDTVNCNGVFTKSTLRNVIKEVIFIKATGNDDEMRNYLLSKLKKSGITQQCYCYLCYFLKSYSSIYGRQYICSRYKTKGTPRNPLDTKPVNCPYFSIDRNVERHIAEVSDQMEIIEL